MEEINAPILEQEIEPQYILDVQRYIFLALITFGLYNLWWNYKTWRFFQQKDNSDISPAMRTIFGIFFLIPLFSKVINFAKKKGYQKNYSPSLLFFAYLAVVLLSYLPIPISLFSVFAFVFFIKPFEAFNYARANDTGYEVIEQRSFNGRQIFLIVMGSIWWLLILASLFLMMTQQNEYPAY